MSDIRSAVILAAGLSTRLRDVFNGQPKGFLPLGGQPIMERSIELLRSHGIEKIIIVTGYLSSDYDALASTYEGVHTVYNPLYAESGSMYSLYCAREQLEAPFLLLESDLIYEQRALQTLLTTPKENAILISGFTNAGDEIYIGTNGYPQRISGLSKKPQQLTHIIGELVGLSKISAPLWHAMIDYSEAHFRHDLRLDYEEGTLHAIAHTTEIFFCKVDDLLWAEIDEASHWQRAKEIILPQIQAKEGQGARGKGQRAGGKGQGACRGNPLRLPKGKRHVGAIPCVPKPNPPKACRGNPLRLPKPNPLKGAPSMNHIASLPTIESNTLVEVLRSRARHQPSQRAYTFLVDGEREEVHLSYGELDQQARVIAARLQQMGISGERALLLYPPGLDFIAAFFGCLYAGVVAVPSYPPRRKRASPRLEAIVQDAQPAVVLSDATIRADVIDYPKPALMGLEWLVTDDISHELGEAEAALWQMPTLSSKSLAFLQYTSGSTATPKGVMLTHGNLLHNLAIIQQGFEATPNSVGVIWLPPYHDMGLIGGILEPLYVGMQVVLMSPFAFLQKPIRWLQAVSHYKGTISGGPNFAYELCLEKITPQERASLDLSSWEVAFNGAEPIRNETLERFVKAFAPCGFRREAFYPCYGLAEGTLIVSGGMKSAAPVVYQVNHSALLDNRVVESADGMALLGCGTSKLGQKIVIVDPESMIPCPDGQVGEIWVKGASVAKGYWNKANATEDTCPAESERFHAYLAESAPTPSPSPNTRGGEQQDYHIPSRFDSPPPVLGEGLGVGAGPFLRTGDLGFLLDGELFVTGRIKDLIIIRGRNHYPQDIELTAQKSHMALQPHCGAAFSVEVEGQERVVIVFELKRRYRKADVEEVAAAIRAAVSQEHELEVYAVVLIRPARMPKTTSGKVQRYVCRKGFLEGSLPIIGSSIRDVSALRHASRQGAVDNDEPTEPTETEPSDMTNTPMQAEIEADLRVQIANLLSVPPAQIDLQQPIRSLGIGSLAAIMLKTHIEESYQLTLPMEIFFEEISISQMVTRVLRERSSETDVEMSQPSPPMPAQAQTSNQETPLESTEHSADSGSMSEQNPETYRFDLFPESRYIEEGLQNLQVANPYFRGHEGINNDQTLIGDRLLINYSSYNYLGMSGDELVSDAAREAIARYGTSVSASRLVSGEIPLHSQLEKELADLVGTEDCLAYVGGHATNVTTIGHLLGPQDLILHDALIHNSALQGAMLSGADRLSFPHNDWQALDQILTEKRAAYRRVLIVIEGVYSMDGDIPALPKFIAVKKRHHAFLMIDEAHSIGVVGQQGRGIGEYFGVNPAEVDIWMGTLSKSFASCGGYIAGSNALIQYLKYTAPGFVYSVGMSPPNTAAALAAVRLLKREPERVTRLQQRTKLFLELARARGLNTGNSKDSPVVPVIIGNAESTMYLSHLLFERGISVHPMLPPAVPDGESRLRFFISSTHSEEQIRFTVDTVAEALAELAKGK